MRLPWLLAWVGVTAILLAGCSTLETSMPAVNDLLSSPTPVSLQSEGTVVSNTQSKPAVDPYPIENPVLPATQATGSIIDPSATNPPEGSEAPLVAAPTEAPSPTPLPALRQLTGGGCCVQPIWSSDAAQVLYIDRPSADAPSGLWGVPVQGGEPQFITDQLGIYSPDMQLLATLVNGTTIIERVATGEQWTIPNDGRAVSFSPDGSWVAWTAGQSGPPFDTAQRQVWISRFDGSQVQEVFSSVSGGFAGWFPDGRLMVSGRVEGSDTEQAYWALSLDSEQPGRVELARGERLRDALISKDGNWLAYMVTFSQDPAQDGLWLVNTHTGERRLLDVFGSYQWRDGDRLLVVPLDLSQPAHRLLQVQAATGEVQVLTDPAAMPFRIANGDWSVSPDGRSVVFSSAQDGNIWVLEIPGL